jgi:hypothetical protein
MVADMSDTHETPAAGAPEEGRMPLPPATFSFLVWSLRTQAEVQLGISPFGGDEDQPDLNLARHTIDMMAMLLEKTKGNLTIDEQRLIENSLTELRFRFVQVSEAPPAKTEPAAGA